MGFRLRGSRRPQWEEQKSDSTTFRRKISKNITENVIELAGSDSWLVRKQSKRTHEEL